MTEAEFYLLVETLKGTWRELYRQTDQRAKRLDERTEPVPAGTLTFWRDSIAAIGRETIPRPVADCVRFCLSATEQPSIWISDALRNDPFSFPFVALRVLWHCELCLLDLIDQEGDTHGWNETKKCRQVFSEWKQLERDFPLFVGTLCRIYGQDDKAIAQLLGATAATTKFHPSDIKALDALLDATNVLQEPVPRIPGIASKKIVFYKELMQSIAYLPTTEAGHFATDEASLEAWTRAKNTTLNSLRTQERHEGDARKRTIPINFPDVDELYQEATSLTSPPESPTHWLENQLEQHTEKQRLERIRQVSSPKERLILDAYRALAEKETPSYDMVVEHVKRQGHKCSVGEVKNTMHRIKKKLQK